MTTTLDRAVEDALARGENPELIEALKNLVKQGKAKVIQTEGGDFRFQAIPLADTADRKARGAV